MSCESWPMSATRTPCTSFWESSLHYVFKHVGGEKRGIFARARERREHNCVNSFLLRVFGYRARMKGVETSAFLSGCERHWCWNQPVGSPRPIPTRQHPNGIQTSSKISPKAIAVKALKAASR